MNFQHYEDTIQVHAYINLVTGDKQKTMTALHPILKFIDADEIDDESILYEIRFYFDGVNSACRIASAKQVIDRALRARQTWEICHDQND